MEPLIALVTVTLALLAAGAAGVRRFRPWPVALRGGLAAMFTLTGMAHFFGLRAELVAMVPPSLPNPGLLVTLTGLLELAGAAGLLIRRTTPWAAGCLTALLILMFPANVYAAAEGLSTGPFEALIPRTLLQVVFLSATLAVAISSVRGRATESPSAAHSLAAPGAALPPAPHPRSR
ncbi:DoxX family protein [Rhodococcus koreensis]